MNKDISITEVARKAGVSTATVSRVFHNTGPVKEATRKKIEAIIEETGYSPNQLARELANKKTHLIGLIVHDFTGEGIPRSIDGVNSVLENHGYNVLMTCSRGDLQSELRNFEILRSKRVEGIVFATREFKPEHQEIINKLPIPVVVMLQDTKDDTISSVSFQNYHFSYEATTKLIGLNHKQFAFFGGPTSSVNSENRKQGFLDAIQDHDISSNDAIFKHCDFSIEQGYIEMSKVLSLKQDFTALITINDGVAVGAINCLLDHGISVPEDVSVLALDETVLANASRISLSGVRYSYQELGTESAKLLLEQIRDGQQTKLHKRVPYEINLRDSVKKLEEKKEPTPQWSDTVK